MALDGRIIDKGISLFGMDSSSNNTVAEAFVIAGVTRYNEKSRLYQSNFLARCSSSNFKMMQSNLSEEIEARNVTGHAR